MESIFITGIAGFIGYHVACRLCELGYKVYGCDNFNNYYDPLLKKKRASHLKRLGIDIIPLSIEHILSIKELFLEKKIETLIHLAAQAGVRYSLINPESYVSSNLIGFAQILELCRSCKDIRLIFASSSSVYGLNTKTPFSESDSTDNPANLYAATKKSNELLAYSYHHLFKIPMIGLRFFTVYGPWGRPDMAYYFFTKAIKNEEPIELYNYGLMKRDFTYIDDITDGIISSLKIKTGYEIFNLGNNRPEKLMSLIESIEAHLGKKAIIDLKPLQNGDVIETWADLTKSQSVLGFFPKISLYDGIGRFIEWYQKEIHSL